MKKTYILLFIIFFIFSGESRRNVKKCIQYKQKDDLESLKSYEPLDKGVFRCKDKSDIFSCFYGDLTITEFDYPENDNIEYCFDTRDVQSIEYDEFFKHTCDLFFPFNPDENPHILLQK